MFDQDKLGTGPIDENLLQAYADGQLDYNSRIEVEAYLARNPREASRISDYIKQTLSLRGLYNRRLGSPQPPEMQALQVAIVRELEEAAATSGDSTDNSRFFRGIQWPTRKFIAAAGVCIGLITGGWITISTVTSEGYSTDSMVAAVSRLFADQEEQASADDMEAMLTQLDLQLQGDRSELLDSAPAMEKGAGAPNLTDFGFEVVGTRQLGTDEMHSIRFTYEADNGRQVMLYVEDESDSDRASITLMQKGLVSLLIWSDKNRTYTMIGEVSRTELLLIGIGVIEAIPERSERIEGQSADDADSDA